MIWLYVLMAGVLACDQITKSWIQNTPDMHTHVEVIRNFFYIDYVKNTGAAWNILDGRQTFLSLLAAVAIVAMGMYMFRSFKKKEKISAVAFALMIAGAAGNLLDRLMLSFVRDFLHFYPFGYDFPVFNVADIALTVGVCLLLIALFLEDEDRKNRSKNERIDDHS